MPAERANLMSSQFKRILIIADIEGSSGCWNYRASSFITAEWARACVEMTRDVNAVVQALFDSGVAQIRVKDQRTSEYTTDRHGPVCHARYERAGYHHL